MTEKITPTNINYWNMTKNVRQRRSYISVSNRATCVAFQAKESIHSSGSRALKIYPTALKLLAGSSQTYSFI